MDNFKGKKKRELITSAVFRGLAEFCDLGGISQEELVKRPLYGIDSLIESLSLVLFLASIENDLQGASFDKKNSLLQELLNQELVPLSTVEGFIDFLTGRYS